MHRLRLHDTLLQTEFQFDFLTSVFIIGQLAQHGFREYILQILSNYCMNDMLVLTPSIKTYDPRSKYSHRGHICP